MAALSCLSFGPVCSTQAAVPVVENGEAKAVVVTARPATPTTEYAARELVWHVERATGVALLVATEDQIPQEYPSRIYVGDTQAAREQGVDVDALGPDVFVLKTAGSNVIVAGKESKDADPLDPGLDQNPNPFGGPLFGVYELLERDLGVRWLWPGELGTVVPRADRVVISPADEEAGPKLTYRLYRLGRMVESPVRYHRADKTLRRLAGFTNEGFDRYSRDLRVYYRRHRMGFSEPVRRGGHSIVGVQWRTHGEEHPDWFGMDESGQRGFGEPRKSGRVPYCVSNAEMHRHIVEKAWDGSDWLGLGERDSTRYCHCPDCMAWDGPQPKGAPTWSVREFDVVTRDSGCRIVSDRYARFWKTVYDLAVQRNPNVKTAALIYVNYFPAPLKSIELNKNIHGMFCPFGFYTDAVWFPMPERSLEWLKEQWLGWHRTGISLTYRPNDTLNGYTMPALNTWQRGSFIRLAGRHGMIGMDVDGLIAQWAVRGPEHYLYFRLMADPARTVGDIRQEYFSSFGPAAPHVERYFDYWEDYQYKLLEADNWGVWDRYAFGVGGVQVQYPPEVFVPAAKILDEALAAVAATELPECAERVKFLQAGLEHARLCARFVGTVDGGGRARHDPILPADTEAFGFKAAQQALHDLMSFRSQHQRPYIADYARTARLELRRLRTDVETLLSAMDAESGEADGVVP